MAEKYILRVTAGPGYDADSQVEVPVNKPQPVKIATDLADIELNVRIQNYAGLPRQSPETSPYFSQEPHAANNDQYSIALRFTPKKPSTKASAKDGEDGGSSSGDGGGSSGISAADLQFGNDFDHPIRDRLPPGFNTAMNIVKWWIDPGLEGDAYADSPYLYGPALSSFNVMHVGAGTYDEEKGGLWFDEGGDERGLEARKEVGAPAAAKDRMKWALRGDSKERWVFEYGRTYAMDFFNPYLDFSNLALRLPGFQLAIMKYWDGQGLRYVLRNRFTGAVYLVVLFTLYLKTDVNEDGSLKEGVEGVKVTPPSSSPTAASEQADQQQQQQHDETKALDEARRQMGPSAREAAETSADDVD